MTRRSGPPRRGRVVVIAGCGGQGVLTSAQLIAEVFVAGAHDVVCGQLHGMAQRAGCVQGFVKIDHGPAPAVARGGADLLLGMEPVETVRAMPLVGPGAAVIMNTAPLVPFVIGQAQVRQKSAAGYPDVSALVDHVRSVVAGGLLAHDLTQVALEAGSVRTVSAVALGCAIGSGRLGISEDTLLEAIRARVPAKLREENIRAYRAGVALGRTICSADRADGSVAGDVSCR